jgi:hypothetical protein
MEGDKNDRPKWINTVFRQTIYDILANTNPTVNLEKAVSDLESGNVNPELLKRSNRLSKNTEEYENKNCRKRKIGLAVGARKSDIIEYYESDAGEGYSLDPQEMSIRKYIIMLWKAVRDILEISGYEIVSIEQELFQLSISHMMTPSPGVAGISSYVSTAGANKVAKNENKGGDLLRRLTKIIV